MINFKISGIQITFEFSFFAFMALMNIFYKELAMLLLGACLVHEAGHIIAVYSFDGRIKAVSFSAMGIKIVSDKSACFSDIKEIIILMFGPLFNFIFFFFSVLIFPLSEEFAYINLALAVFNLLPFSKLDGGNILLALCEKTSLMRNPYALLKSLALILIICNLMHFFFCGKLYAINFILLFYSVCELN